MNWNCNSSISKSNVATPHGGNSTVANLALISDDGLHRYVLSRIIGDNSFSGPTIAFGLHNPSTADATQDDPTWRRCIGFATAWGARKVIIINPWAGRATSPKDLWHMVDSVGELNDYHVSCVAGEVKMTGGFIVYGWGAIKPPCWKWAGAMSRLRRFDRIVRSRCQDVRHLGLTKEGWPKHPLYLRANTVPQSLGELEQPWSTETLTHDA
jgi:hypothetical protein